MTLQIEKDKALKAYKEGSDSEKKLLANLLGNDVFTPQKITDRVKNMRDVCDVLGRDYDVEFSDERTKWLTPYERAFKEATLIAQALNEGWVPDYSNSVQYKWSIYYKWVSGVGLSFYGAFYGLALTYAAPRLVFKTSELAQYAATSFPDTYNELFSLPKA